MGRCSQYIAKWKKNMLENNCVFVKTLCGKIIDVRLKCITLSDWIWIFSVWFFCLSFFDCASITFVISKNKRLRIKIWAPPFF